MLFAATNPQTLLLFALISVAGFFLMRFVGKGVVKVDTAVEERRRWAQEIAIWARTNGFPEIATLLLEYSVGNYSGVVEQFRTIKGMVSDKDRMSSVVDGFLKIQLREHLSDTDKREKLIQFVEEHLAVGIPRDAITPVKRDLLTEEEASGQNPIS